MTIQGKSNATDGAGSPDVVPPSDRKRASSRSFLSDVVIDYGPADVLGRLFLKADNALRIRGVTLTFATFDELLLLNEKNADSWRPLLPVFDPTHSHVGSDNGFVIIGRDASGQAVTAHAFRYFNIGARSIKCEMESLRVFYSDPESVRLPGEAMIVTAPSAANWCGQLVFSGAVWIRPDFRKAGLIPHIMPIVRGLAYTRWQTNIVFSVMAPELVKCGFANEGQFPNVEWEVTMINTPVLRNGTIHAALVSTSAEAQLAHFREYLAPSLAPADAVRLSSARTGTGS